MWKAAKPGFFRSSTEMENKKNIIFDLANKQEYFSILNKNPQIIVAQSLQNQEYSECVCVAMCGVDPQRPGECINVCEGLICESFNQKSFEEIKKVLNSVNGKEENLKARGSYFKDFDKNVAFSCNKYCIEKNCLEVNEKCFDSCLEQCKSMNVKNFGSENEQGYTTDFVWIVCIVGVLVIGIFKVAYKISQNKPKKYVLSSESQNSYLIIKG